MFYRPEDGHGLPHNPFNALIAPRPIAWISTQNAAGAPNLAPYSFFNGVAYTPPQVMFASTGAKPDQENTKDTLANIRETGVFCINLVEYSMRDAMNTTTEGFDKNTDEFAAAGLMPTACTTIPCPRLVGAPASLECQMTQIVELEGDANFLTVGRVTGIHMRDDCIIDGKFDVAAIRLLSRLGYRDYSTVESVFTLARPDD
jgi:flavin reductase (DIM6/NTAB) family NADH-FMN oxidoreductase RutF